MSIFAKNYLQGEFTPRHPEKCLNTNGKFPNAHPITFRSSWEKVFANWCDLNPNIQEWGSELIQVDYFSKIDGKSHRYITDFMFTCVTKDNKIEKWLIEVKPKSQIPVLNEAGQIIFPQLNKGKRLTQKKIHNWEEECNVLKRNHEKWTAAREWCKHNDYKFKVICEDELLIKT